MAGSKFPPSVVEVETAIPAFVGYTGATQYKGENLLNRPVAVNNLLEFQAIFGPAPLVGNFVVSVDEDGNVVGAVADPKVGPQARFRLAYAMRQFYDNGGGRCYGCGCEQFRPHASRIGRHSLRVEYPKG